MGDYVQLNGGGEEAGATRKEAKSAAATRIASLDVFRGLSIALMVFVDYAGSVLPYVGHAPWDGVHLADFVMPFFLFIAGISVSIVYKNKANKVQSTRKAVVRAVKLFVLGVLLQGGYFHVINSLTFGVDIDRIRVFGILQDHNVCIVQYICGVVAWHICTRLEIRTTRICSQFAINANQRCH